jgi:hypothetical protein
MNTINKMTTDLSQNSQGFHLYLPQCELELLMLANLPGEPFSCTSQQSIFTVFPILVKMWKFRMFLTCNRSKSGSLSMASVLAADFTTTILCADDLFIENCLLGITPTLFRLLDPKDFPRCR